MAGKAKIGAVIALEGEKEFKQAVTGVNKELTNLKSQSALVKEQFDGQANTVEALQKKHEVLSRVLDTHKKKEEEINKGLKHSKESYEAYGKKLEELKKTYILAEDKLRRMESASSTTTEELEKQRKEVERLKRGLEGSQKNYQIAAERVQNWETKLNRAQAETLKANRALEQNDKYLKEAKSSLNQCAKSIDEYGKKVKEASNTILTWKEAIKTAVAEKGIDTITDATKSLGEATIGTANDITAAQNQVQASTGATKTEMLEYQKVMYDLYKNNYGDNFEDVANAVSFVKQNLKELNNEDLQEVTKGALTLRDTFDMDLQESIRGAEGLMENMNVSATTAFDLMGKAAQNGLNKSNELGDNLAEYSQLWGQMGFSAEQMFSILQNGLDSGAYNLDKVNDYVKEFGNSLADGRIEENLASFSEQTQGLFYQWKNGSVTTAEVFNSVINDLAGMTNQQEALTLASNTWSALGEDNAMKVITSLNQVNGTYQNVAGTMSEIQNIKYDDATNQITKLSRTIQMKFAEPFAEEALPAINAGLEKVGDNLEEVKIVTVGLGSVVAIYKVKNTELFKSVVSSIKKAITATKDLEKATVGATIAQKALVAFKSLPAVGKATLGIVALTTALVAYKEISKNAKTETDEFIESLEEKRKSIESDVTTIQQHSKNVEAEWGANEKLLTKLKDLNDTENKNTGQKEMMKNIVSELSESIPELAEKFDEESCSLKMTSEEMDALHKTHKDYAMYLAHQEMYKEYAKQLTEIEIATEEANDKIKELQADIEKDASKTSLYSYNGRSYDKRYSEIKELEEQLEELADEHEIVDGKMQKSADKSEEYAKSSKTASAAVAEYTAAVEKNGGTVENVTEGQAEAYQQLKESIEENIKSSISLFEKFNGGQQISAEEVRKNLQSQIEGMKNWESNMEKLAAATGEGMTNEFYNYLAEMGPQSANLIQTLVDTLENDTEEFSGICQDWTDAMGFETAGENVATYFNTKGQQIAADAKTNAQKAGDAYASGLNEKKEIIWSVANDIYSGTKRPFSNAYNDFSGLGASIGEGLKAGMDSKQSVVTTAGVNLIESTFQASKKKANVNSPSRLFRDGIGKPIAEGMAVGISQGSKYANQSVAEVCQGILTAAQVELDIHSPSRKFKNQVGAQISKGMAFGIRAKKGVAIKESKSLADDVYKAATKWLKKYKKTHNISLEDEKYFWKKVAATTKKGTKSYKDAFNKAMNIEKFQKKIKTKLKDAFNVSQYTTGSNGEQKKKSVADYYGEIYSKASTYIENQKVLYNISLQKEEYYWKQVRAKLKKGTQAYVDATKKIKDLKEQRAAQVAAEKEDYKSYALSGGALDAYKTYYKVSAKAEVEYWKIVRDKFKAGTAERLEATQKYLEAKENLNEQLEELNEEYYENCKETNEKLAEDIQSLTDEYNDAFKERKEAIYSSFNLFDEFESKSVSGGTLLYNLKTQVAGYADWEQQLNELESKKKLSAELMQELKAMGPEASASIHALNQLSDTQLAEYDNLWKQKKALSESQAVKDNEALKAQTEKKIAELKKAAQAELKAYKSEYKKAYAELNKSMEAPLKAIADKATDIGEDTVLNMIKGIKNKATKKSTKADLKKVEASITSNFKTLPSAGKTIGDNTLQGIIDGLTNKKKINKSAKSMVDALKKAIKEAADIHSPSRLFKREIGAQLSAGVAEGIEDNQKSVDTAGEDMIKGLLQRSKEQMARQQKELEAHVAEVNSGAGLVELNNLISVVPVQQKIEATVDNSQMLTMLQQMMSVMESGFEQMGNMQVVTDTGALIGATSTGMSNAFAMMGRRLR